MTLDLHNKYRESVVLKFIRSRSKDGRVRELENKFKDLYNLITEEGQRGLIAGLIFGILFVLFFKAIIILAMVSFLLLSIIWFLAPSEEEYKVLQKKMDQDTDDQTKDAQPEQETTKQATKSEESVTIN